MSPRKSRISSAFTTGMQQAEDKPPVDPGDLRSGGNWSKMAMDSMEERLKEAQDQLGRAHEATYQGILNGTVPIAIPVDQIFDDLGTDRITSSESAEAGEDFDALVDNIRRRGLRVPLRVRPRNPEWAPTPAYPREVGAQMFQLQSGRRRLAACKALGIDPIAFLSFVDPDQARVEDLHERFFENAARKNLTMVEKLYSIGLIASETEGATQSQIGEIIGVSTAYVSRGLAVLEHFERLKADLDLAEATRDDIDEALKKYREEGRKPSAARDRKKRQRAKGAASLPFRTRSVGQAKASLRINTRGERVLSLSSQSLDDRTIERILKVIEGG